MDTAKVGKEKNTHTLCLSRSGLVFAKILAFATWAFSRDLPALINFFQYHLIHVTIVTQLHSFREMETVSQDCTQS